MSLTTVQFFFLLLIFNINNKRFSHFQDGKKFIHGFFQLMCFHFHTAIQGFLIYLEFMQVHVVRTKSNFIHKYIYIHTQGLSVLKVFLLRFNSHTIKFTLFNCVHFSGFQYFTKLCTYHCYKLYLYIYVMYVCVRICFPPNVYLVLAAHIKSSILLSES